MHSYNRLAALYRIKLIAAARRMNRLLQSNKLLYIILFIIASAIFFRLITDQALFIELSIFKTHKKGSIKELIPSAPVRDAIYDAIIYENVTLQNILDAANTFPVYDMSQELDQSMYTYIGKGDVLKPKDGAIVCCTLIEATREGLDDLLNKLFKSSLSVRRRCHWAILVYGGKIRENTEHIHSRVYLRTDRFEHSIIFAITAFRGYDISCEI